MGKEKYSIWLKCLPFLACQPTSQPALPSQAAPQLGFCQETPLSAKAWEGCKFHQSLQLSTCNRKLARPHSSRSIHVANMRKVGLISKISFTSVLFKLLIVEEMQKCQKIGNCQNSRSQKGSGRWRKKNPSSTHFLPHLSSAFQWSSRSNFAFQTLAQLRFTPSHLWTRHVKSSAIKSFGSGINHHLQDVWLQRCRINQNHQRLDVQGYWTIIQLDEVDLAFVCLHQTPQHLTPRVPPKARLLLATTLKFRASRAVFTQPQTLTSGASFATWVGLDIMDGFLWFLQVNGPFVQPCSCPYHQQLQCAWSQCGRPHNCCSLAMWISEAEHGICSIKPSDPTYTYQRYTKKNICYRHHHTKQCCCLFLLLLTQQLRQLQNAQPAVRSIMVVGAIGAGGSAAAWTGAFIAAWFHVVWLHQVAETKAFWFTMVD